MVELADPNTYYSTYVLLNPLYKWFQPGTVLGAVTGPRSSDRADWGNSPLINNPDQAHGLLAGTHRVWLSNDGGAAWTAISPDLTGGYGVLRSLAKSGPTIYAGANTGVLSVSSDGGATWQVRSTGLPAAAIPEIVLDPLTSATAYICSDVKTGSRVFVTKDAGVTWTDLTGDLPANTRAMSLAAYFPVLSNGAGKPMLYLGTDYGASTSMGVSWRPSGVPNVAVYAIRVDHTNRLVVAATHGRGIWRAHAGENIAR